MSLRWSIVKRTYLHQVGVYHRISTLKIILMDGQMCSWVRTNNQQLTDYVSHISGSQDWLDFVLQTTLNDLSMVWNVVIILSTKSDKMYFKLFRSFSCSFSASSFSLSIYFFFKVFPLRDTEVVFTQSDSINIPLLFLYFHWGQSKSSSQVGTNIFMQP